MKNVDELIVLFRQFGGKFENIELRHSKDAGYYCHSLDSDKDSIISCPANLIVDVDDLGINAEGIFIANPEKYGNNINFLRKYFAFHFNKAVVAQHTKTKRQIESLSDRDLSIISNILPSDAYKLKEDNNLEYEKREIIRCHKISHGGKKVIMPFVTFLNYNKNGQSYDANSDRISVSGKFNGEICAKYNDDDVLIIGGAYGFIADTKTIYSIPLTYKTLNGKKIVINRKPLEAIYLGNGRWKPLVKETQDCITISWFPLYLEGANVYPAKIAKMIANELNLPAENLLFNIIKLNLHALIPAVFQLRESNNKFATYLARVIQRQLETIAGTRK